MSPPQPEAARDLLFGLGEDSLLVAIARFADVPAALRLLQGSKVLDDKLRDTVMEMVKEQPRLWVIEPEISGELYNGGRTVVQAHDDECNSMFAHSRLLPSVGRTTFTVRVNESYRGRSGVAIGVCNADATYAWTIDLFEFDALRAGELELCRLLTHRGDQRVLRSTSPPQGFPRGDPSPVITPLRVDDVFDNPLMMNRPPKTEPSEEVDVTISYDERGHGWLSFCIRKGREVLETSQELGRFPRRKSLRPFVHLHGYPGTAVSLVRGA
tara:strand:+ start:433 stop:1239 length:807 start_codon:yes stop_codon:yes gene_type:complete